MTMVLIYPLSLSLGCYATVEFLFALDYIGVSYVVCYMYLCLQFVWFLSFLVVLYCGRVPAANAPGCTAAEGLLYKPWSLVVPTCTARCLHQKP